MKPRYFFTLLLCVFIAIIGTDAFAATGDKISTTFTVSGVCSLAGTTNSVLTIGNLPANGGSYVLTGVDVVILTGTAVSAAPTIQVTSGATNLSSAAALSGTTPSTVIRPTLSAPLPLVVTGGSTAPLSIKITSAGTATNLDVKTVFRGYWLP